MQLCQLETSLGGRKLGLGRGEAVLGILKILQRVDMGSVELRLPLQILLLLRECRLSIFYLPSSNADLRLEVVRIDLEEQVTLLYLLVISNRNPYNRTRNSRCDLDNVCADLAISCPGILAVTRVEGKARPAGQTNNY
jgi:hypothetical protein